MNTRITTTLRRTIATAILAVAIPVIAACGGGPGDPVVEACERFDECNVLNAGVSVGECVEEVDRFRDNFTPSERNDWDQIMEGCLAFDGCSTFLNCVDSNNL